MPDMGRACRTPVILFRLLMRRGQRAFVIACAVLTMLGALAWWAKDGGYEPLVVLVAAFGTLATVQLAISPEVHESEATG